MQSDDLIYRKDALDALKLAQKTIDILYVPLRTRQALKNIQAVDAVPVIRCCFCQHGKPTGTEYLCDKHSGHENALGEDRRYEEYHSGEWYCADGKRREAEP